MSESPELQRADNQKEERTQVSQEEEEEEEEEDEGHEQEARRIHGLLVSYQDDGIDASVQSALQNKKRLHYKCMDVHANLVALGTSVGSIYLFRLASVTHASCSLAERIACDQGPIEVIKFVPTVGFGGGGQLSHAAANSFLVVIGTSRGSIVIFRLTVSTAAAAAAATTDTHSDSSVVHYEEIYKTAEFTRSEYEPSIGIKLIEYDQDLFDPGAPFTKLYICDQRNRIFVLDQSIIFPGIRGLARFSQKPAPILSVNESTIHQICVHRSQLLLSTDEKTRLFSEYSNELLTIGKKQRKTKGFFGACFYNANFKPARLQPPPAPGAQRVSAAYSQQTIYSSTASLAELENLLIFVARPKFSLWQVNCRREVMFTHILEEPIKESDSGRSGNSQIVQLHNEPLSESADGDGRQVVEDDCASIQRAFGSSRQSRGDRPPTPNTTKSARHKTSDHFEILMPIFSATLGNLLLSHTRHELYVVDPIGARLIVAHAYERPIQQVCCVENEIFVMLGAGQAQASAGAAKSQSGRQTTRLERLVLLAPTQFVLELHRLNRFLSLTAFVQLFHEQFKQLMALPLSGPSTLTTEGGLLRNIVWNTWREIAGSVGTQQEESEESSNNNNNNNNGDTYPKFREIVEAIAHESRQFRQSLENLADSQLFLEASHENLERLCSEPYASMVSLDISIANLHSNHVVHFSQEALARHKSLAKLSQSIMNISQLQRSAGGAAAARASLLDLAAAAAASAAAATNSAPKTASQALASAFDDKRVIVEPLRPRTINLKPQAPTEMSRALQLSTGLSLGKIDEAATAHSAEDDQQLTPVGEAPQGAKSGKEHLAENGEPEEEPKQEEGGEEGDPMRCANCQWPRARAHLKPMHHSQQIQFGWLQENLLPNFEENIEQIQERAFKHGLWHVVLRCLAFKNQLEDYVRCCLMLDDVRLLNAKRFIITRGSEDQLIDLVFKQLEQKLDLLEKHQQEGSEGKIICLKCGHGTTRQRSRSAGHSDSDDDDAESDDDGQDGIDDDDDEISFNLVGLFKKLLRKSADVKRAINMLLQHPNLLEKSEIPATFYLEALSLYPPSSTSAALASSRPRRVGTT